MTELEYKVPDVSCDHCVNAITTEVTKLTGVSTVHVDLEAKRVTVQGTPLDDTAIREAIDEAGYNIA